MCGRFTLTTPAAEVAKHFGVAMPPDWTARYNIAPTQAVPVVRQPEPGGGRVLEMRTWGLVPGFAADPSVGARMINARVETAAEKKAYRDALRRRRCLVPADGFYEWTGGRSGPRQPHRIGLPGGRLFAMAGLFEHWDPAEGEAVESFTILTASARGPVRALHDRMPVLLEPARYDAWLDPGDPDGAGRLGELGTALAEALVVTPANPRVNDVRNDDPACLEADQLSLL